MTSPIEFPRTAGTTTPYLHPVLQSAIVQSTALQSTARPAEAVASTPPTREPAVAAVVSVQATAAYSESLARDAATAVRSASATAKATLKGEQVAYANPPVQLARQAALDRASSQVGMLLTRAAAERRMALNSGLPASRLAMIDTTTSRLYRALDVLV